MTASNSKPATSAPPTSIDQQQQQNQQQRLSSALHRAYLGNLLSKHERGEPVRYEDLMDSWDRVVRCANDSKVAAGIHGTGSGTLDVVMEDSVGVNGAVSPDRSFAMVEELMVRVVSCERWCAAKWY